MLNPKFMTYKIGSYLKKIEILESFLFILLPDIRKSRMYLAVGAQVLLNLLELFSIIFIGLFVSVVSLSLTQVTPGEKTGLLLALLGLESFDINHQIVVLGIGTVSILILKTFLSAILMKRVIQFLNHQAYKASEFLMKKLADLGQQDVQNIAPRQLAYAYTTGVYSIVNGVLGNIFTLVTDLFLIIVICLGLAIADFRLTLMMFIYFAMVSIVSVKWVRRSVKQRASENAIGVIKGNELIEEFIFASREIYLNQSEIRYTENFSKIRQNIARNSTYLGFVPYLSKFILETSFVIAMSGVITYQAFARNVEGALAITSMFFLGSLRMAPAILRLQNSVLNLQQNLGLAEPTIRTIEIILNGNNKIRSYTTSKIMDEYAEIAASVDFEDVEFSFPGANKKILAGCTFYVNPGEHIGICGPSGSGKSTLVNLLTGAIQPVEGTIRINGKTPNEILSSRPGYIGYVPQDPYFKDGTLRENLLIGAINEEYNDMELIEALGKAGLEISEISNGADLNRRLENTGSGLSGGQKQRMALARALLARPKLLILDEATSALDPITRTKLVDYLETLKGDITVISVSHQVEALIHCNKIYSLSIEGQLCLQK